MRAGLLNQLIAAAGPAIVGKLGSLLGNRTPDASTSITEADAQRISPEQVSDIAQHAEKADPSVMDRIGSYYAKNPEVVKVLGGAALAIALGRLANRNPR
jgi:hypothetical protein